MGEGGVDYTKIEKVSLEIANHWSDTNFLNERNDNSGVLVAFDWKENNNSEYYLSEINTNIDLSKLESEKFDYNAFSIFLKVNEYTFVVGLENVNFSPNDEWLDKLKNSLKSKSVDYDKYTVQAWPSPIPKLETPNNVFILRYCFDTNNQIDELAASNELFSMFIRESEWRHHQIFEDSGTDWDKIKEKKRVIVMCSEVKNIILHREYVKEPKHVILHRESMK